MKFQRGAFFKSFLIAFTHKNKNKEEKLMCTFKIIIMDDMKTAMSSSCIAEGCDGEKNNSNLKLICLENGANGLGIKLSKSTWDPYPFVSFVDETREQLHGLQIGDCLLKVVLFVGDSSKDI